MLKYEIPVVENSVWTETALVGRAAQLKELGVNLIIMWINVVNR